MLTIYSHHRLRFYRRGCLPVTLMTGDISFGLVTERDFPWAAHPLEEFTDQYRQRFATGVRALIGLDGDRVAFSAWIEEHRMRVEELRFNWTLPEPDAVVFDVVTMPDYRGRGLYPDALRRLCGMLAEEGMRHLWIYADERNTASIRGIEKADFEYHGSIVATTVLGVTRHRGRIPGVNT